MDSEIVLPPLSKIEASKKMTPEYMYPSVIPHAAVLEGALSNDICDRIIDTYMSEEPYSFTNCHAATRECPMPLAPVLSRIKLFGLEMNLKYWNFDLDNNAAAWLQTYKEGDSYQIHMDGLPGSTRKLTVIALLSNPMNYHGGQLRLIPYPEFYDISQKRGTLVAFPPWILHEVHPITYGLRQTINLGFWGPAFR